MVKYSASANGERIGMFVKGERCKFCLEPLQDGKEGYFCEVDKKGICYGCQHTDGNWCRHFPRSVEHVDFWCVFKEAKK